MSLTVANPRFPRISPTRAYTTISSVSLMPRKNNKSYAKSSRSRQPASTARASKPTVNIGGVVIAVDDPNRKESERRNEERTQRRDTRMKEAERLKEEANELFRQGKIGPAAKKYEEILDEYGSVPAVSNNLAACYLKFNAFQQAARAAAATLACEPKNLKARYRRGMAWKGTGNFKGAIVDFITVLKHDPTHDLARAGLREAQEQDVEEGSFDDSLSDSETDEDSVSMSKSGWPEYDMHPQSLDVDVDSDSEDCRHVGNNVPCRFYNHGECSKGGDCAFEHAPDSESVRDGLGKNVCQNFLLDRCTFGDAKCHYSHDSTYLPASGWWTDANDVRIIRGAMRDIKRMDSEFGIPPMPPIPVIRPDVKRRPVLIPPPLGLPPFILALSLGEDDDHGPRMHDRILSALDKDLAVMEATDDDDALCCLASSSLRGVLVTGSETTKREHSLVSTKLVEYVKSGRRGTVVFGGNFGGTVTPSDFALFFAKEWDLPWKMGSYHRTTFQKNTSNVIGRSPIPETCSMKAVHLKGISMESAVYKPTTESRTQSFVFAPDRVALDEAPVVFQRMAPGQGCVGFVGDVNLEPEGIQAIVEMFNHRATQVGSMTPPPQSSRAAVKKPEGKPAASVYPSSSSNAQARKLLPILLFRPGSVFELIYSDVLSAIRGRPGIEPVVVKSDAEALRLLADPSKLAAVFVAEADIVEPEHNAVSITLAATYVEQAGGTVVYGGLFPSDVHSDKFETYMRRMYGLPWKIHSGTKWDLVPNMSCELVKKRREAGLPGLPTDFYTNAVFLSDFSPDTAVYFRKPYEELHDDEEEEEEEEDDVSEEEKARRRREFELECAPVFSTRVGRGRLGYAGFVNGEPENIEVLLSLLGI